MLNFSNFEMYKNNSTDNGLHTDYQYKYALPFEKVDNPMMYTLFLQRYWHHSITISVVYFAIIKVMQWLMKNREPFNLKNTLFYWNAGLAVYSIIGLVRFSEDFFHALYNYGFFKTLCYSCHPNDVAAFWSLMFAISKVIELGDTVFIILRKRPLIFLHYYHHAAVLIYTIHSGAEHTAAGRWFIWMNFLAHSFMYTYYAVVASGCKPPRYVSICVTTVQTTQMLFGVCLSILVFHYKTMNLPCQQSFENLYLAFIIYITFAFLFIRFFVNTYIRPSREKRVKKE